MSRYGPGDFYGLDDHGKRRSRHWYIDWHRGCVEDAGSGANYRLVSQVSHLLRYNREALSIASYFAVLRLARGRHK